MTQDLTRNLGQNLRKKREELGLSQEQLGEQIDLHRTYIGALERGERNPTLKSVQHLAGLLDVDALELLRA